MKKIALLLLLVCYCLFANAKLSGLFTLEISVKGTTDGLADHINNLEGKIYYEYWLNKNPSQVLPYDPDNANMGIDIMSDAVPGERFVFIYLDWQPFDDAKLGDEFTVRAIVNGKEIVTSFQMTERTDDGGWKVNSDGGRYGEDGILYPGDEPTPDISISLSPTTLAYCEGATGGNVTATIANSSNYSLTWKEGATDLSGNGLTLSGANNTVATVDVSKFTAGAHTVTVTATDNTTFKTATADFTLTINPKPTVSLAIDQTAVCEKTSVNLTATANIASGGTIASYTWADKTGFESLTGNSPISATPQTASPNYTYEVTATSDKGCTTTASKALTVNAAPNVPALSAIPVVCEGNTVNLAACVPSDPAIARYDYYKGTFPAGTSVADPTQIAVGGAYYIIGVGTAPTNCRSVAKPATIQINPLPNVKLVANNNDTIICAGESVTLTASGATKYTWGAPLSGTGNTQTVAPTATTTYTVTGTTGTCSKTVSREIKVNPLPTIAMTAQVGGLDVTDVCPGTTVTLTADGKENGVSIITATQYAWTDGVTGDGLTKTVTPTGATTTYNVEVSTIAGCKASASKTINVYTPEKITLTPSKSVCVTEATNTGVTLTASGLGSGSSYSWTDGGGFTGTGATQTVKPSVTTVYTVSGIDVHGCAATAVNTTITVDPMPVLVLAKTDLQSCSNVSLYGAIDLTGAIPGTVYEYATDMAFSTPIGLNVATKVGAGTYFIRAKNGTCVTDVTNAHKVTVTILSSPTLDVKPSLAACDPDKVDLTTAVINTNCSITYWKSDKTTEITTDANSISTTGVYYIKGTLGDCPALFKPVQVNINPTPDVKVNDFAYCASTKGNLTDASVTTGSTGGLTYTYWASGAGRVPVTTPAAVNAGKYKIVGTTTLGCADSAEVVVTENPLPVIATITSDQDACSSTELTVAATATGKATLTYAWSAKGGGSITSANPNQSSVTAKTAATGALNHFVVKVTDGNNCSVLDTVKVTGHKVTPGTIAALPGSVIPCGSAVNLTVNGAKCSETGCAVTYEWRPSTQIASSSTSNATSTNINSDTRFSVKVEDAHGCFDTAFIDITVKGCDFKFDPTMAMVDSICSGSTKNLTAKVTGAEGIPDFKWKEVVPGTGLQAPTNVATVSLNTAGLTAGQVYKYEITASCFAAGQNVIRKDTVEVYIRPLPTFNRTSNGLACAKADVSLNVTNVTGGALKPGDSYAYAWSIAGQGSYKTLPGNAATATGVMADAGGVNGFAVKVSDSYQCASYDTVKMTGHKVNPGLITGKTPIAAGTAQTLTVSGAACSEGDMPLTYTWGPVDSLVAPSTGAGLTSVTTNAIAGNTNFFVEVRDANNCFDTTKYQVNVGNLKLLATADTLCATGATTTASFYVIDPALGDKLTYEWTALPGLSTTSFTITSANQSTTTANVTGAGVCAAEVKLTDSESGLVLLDTAYIKVNPAPALAIAGTGSGCVGTTVNDMTATVTGGTAPIDYTWSGGLSGANPVASIAVPGDNVYALTVTDANGCQAMASHTIVGHQVLVSGTANPGVILVSGVSNLKAVATATPAASAGELKYSWSPATGLNTTTESQVQATLSASQNYMVTVTDGNNCSATTSVRVNVLNETLAVTADNISGCADEVLKLNAMATGGTGSYNYTWSFTDPNLKLSDIKSPTPVVLASTPAGVYNLTVLVNDGKNVKPSATITVTKKALPTLTVGQSLVSGGVYDLTATVNPGSATCTWSPAGMLNGVNTGATVRTVDLTVSQAYTVKAIQDGCSASLPVLVNVSGSPMNVLASAEPGCVNEEIYLNASATGGDGDAANYTYTWKPGAGLTLSQTNVASPKVVSTVPGTYSATVTVSDKAGKSATSNVVTVIVYPKPEVTVNTNAFACQNSEITLTAGGADTYTWLQGVNGTGAVKTATLAATTLYQVVGASANGCRDTADYTVTMRNLPAVSVNVASDVCAGAEVTLSATPDIATNTYTWTGGMTGATVKTTMATPGAVNFTVTVKDADGCINSATKSVTAHAVKVTAAATLNPDKSAFLTATPEFFPAGQGGTPQYIWKDAAKLIADNVQNPTTVVLTQAETFMVTLKDAHGCVDSSEVVVNVTGDGTILAATPGNVAGCAYDTLTLNANATGGDGSYEYTWLRGPGLTLSDTTLAMPEVWTSAPGTYMATVKVKSAGKEVTSAAVSIKIFAKPTVNVPMPAAICSGTDITMTASGALQYNWLSGFTGVLTGASQTVTLATGTTNYKVEGIDANQCRDTFEYSITPAAVPLILAGADRNDVCAGDKVNLWATVNGGLAPYTYTWDGVPADLVVAVAPGVNTYSVTVEDANGCMATATTGDIVGHQVTLTASAVLPVLPIGGGVSNLTAVATAVPADGAALTYAWTPGNKLGGAANLASLPTIHLTSQQTYTVTVTDGYACTATTDVTVNVQSETLSAFARGSLVCINTPATLNAMGLGGSGSYTYNWTGIPAGCTLDNTTIANPTVEAGASAGSHTFTVEVKDSENRTAIATATVTVKALPQVQINGQQKQVVDVCEGQTLTLTASNLMAGDTYFKWVKGFTGNGDTRSEIPTADKTYKVIGTTVDGCADSAVYDIKMQTNPSVIVTSPVADLCRGGDVQLTATANGGSGSYTNYSWADRQTGSQPTVTASVAGDNIYTVTVTDSKGCKATASTTVVGHEVTVVASALKNPVAYDTPATLLAAPTFNPSGKEGRVSYSWTNGLSTEISTSQIATTANLVADETFSVLVTDQYGCTATGSVTINVQAPEGTPLDVNANIKTGPVCIGGSALLSAQAVGGNINAVVPKYTYQWFEKGKTVILANTAAFMPAPTAPVTEYVVQVTDASLPTAKTAYDTVTLTMSTNKAPVANAGLDQTVKKGTVTVLGLASATATEGAPPYTYTWSPAGMLDAGEAVRETPTTVALASDTTYVVYVKDKNGCISLPDEVKVKVADDMFTITAKAAPTQICFANTSQLEVTKVGGTFAAGATFSWSPAANLSNTAIANPVFTAPANVLTPTNYPFTVTVTEGGRSLTTLVSVTVKPGTAPQLQFVGTPHCVGDSVYVKATNAVTVTGTYNWYISDGMPNPKNGKFYEFKASADYDIKVVTTSGNCTSDTLRGVFKIGSKPLVDIQAPRYLVGPRDTVFTFTTNVTPTGTYRYTWKGTLFNPAGGVTGPGGVGATSGSSMTATKLDADVQYVVEAKGIAANSCPAYDTVKVFILPDAPTIDIDTAQDRYHSRIKLAGSDVWATGNTIWSRKWDPYCLTAENGGKYIKEADLATTKTTWDEPAMDSLEFYYATSYREIAELGGARYDARGTSADTVGYKLDSLIYAPSQTASNNVISWMFDMSSKNITTTADFMNFMQKDKIVVAIRDWVVDDQDFTLATTRDPLFDLGFTPDEYAGVFNLRVGAAYQYDVVQPAQFMQYGKLCAPITQILRTSTVATAQNNVFALPFHKAALSNTFEIFELLTTTRIAGIKQWQFEEQDWFYATTEDPLFGLIPGIIQFSPIYKSRPGVSLQIDYIDTTDYTWK